MGRLMGEIHVIDSDGAVSGGFMATRRLLREAPLGLQLWLLLHLPGMGLAWRATLPLHRRETLSHQPFVRQSGRLRRRGLQAAFLSRNQFSARIQ